MDNANITTFVALRRSVNILDTSYNVSDQHDYRHSTTPLPPTFIPNQMSMSKQYLKKKLQPVPLARATGEQFNDLFRSNRVQSVDRFYLLQ